MEITLNRKQFDLLSAMEASRVPLTQRALAARAGMSLGSVNRILSGLLEQGLAANNAITPLGLEALEPYRVQRAVFIAAGFGSRLVPITLNTPKPLVRVHGTRMIDTLLDAVLEAGIEEIYIVRGYLGEQFDQLLYKYPMLRFIENPGYKEANNISSALCARELLSRAYVLEADLVLYRPELIRKYQFTSNYLGVPVKETDDWCFETRNHVITNVMVGGRDCSHMFGISYWNEADGKKLARDIPAVFSMPGGRERYWDEVPLRYCREHYQVEVRDCSFADITEIDSFTDLKKLDPVYGA